VRVVQIGDVCNLMTGGTPSRTHPEYFRNGTIKWLVSGDINKGEIFDCNGRITEQAMKSSITRILPVNSVMIALNGQGKTRGTVALLRTEATCNQSLVSIYPKNIKELLPEYLFHNLKMRYQELRRMTGDDGNDRRGLNMILIRGIEIPLPSLEKQREIVEKLDAAFAESDLLDENILKAISLNDLLLTAKINAEFSEISRDEPIKTLGEFGNIGYGYTAKSSQAYDGPKYLRITDIQDKSVNWQEVPNCEISREDKSKFLLNVGDIVFARTGATTGKSFLIEEEMDAVFASYLIRIKPRIEILNPEFLYYYFQSSYYWNEIAEGISGSAQGGFNASKLQAMSVRFPTDMKVQEAITKRIHDFEIEVNGRSRLLSRQALQISNLRQSLLSSAFAHEEVVA
jgi:type I restriction enzyme S subunit